MKRFERIAALYGCGVRTEQEWGGYSYHDVLYATFGVAPHQRKKRICHAGEVKQVDLAAVHTICQELSGKPLMQFWTGASEVER